MSKEDQLYKSRLKHRSFNIISDFETKSFVARPSMNSDKICCEKFRISDKKNAI